MEPDNLDSFIRALKQENRQTRWDDSGFEQAVQEKIARKEQAMQNAPITLAHFRFFSQAVAPIAALFLIVFLWAYTPRLVPDGKAVETAESSGNRSFIQRNNGFWQKQCPAISAGYLARPSQHHPGTGIGAVATPLPSLSEFPSPSGLHKQTPGWIPGNLPEKRDSGQMTGKRSGMVSKA